MSAHQLSKQVLKILLRKACMEELAAAASKVAGITPGSPVDPQWPEACWDQMRAGEGSLGLGSALGKDVAGFNFAKLGEK